VRAGALNAGQRGLDGVADLDQLFEAAVLHERRSARRSQTFHALRAILLDLVELLDDDAHFDSRGR
jgi:hypothetical protein